MAILKGKTSVVIYIPQDLNEQIKYYRRVTGKGPSDIMPDLLKDFFDKEVIRLKKMIEEKEETKKSRATKSKISGENIKR